MITSRVQLVVLVFSLFYFAYVLWSIRSHRLSVNRSLFWLVSGGAMVICSVFPGMLTIPANWLGFEVPANAIFVFWLFLLTTLLFSQSVTLSGYDQQLRRLAQECALLRDRLETAADITRQSLTAHADRK